MTKAEIEKAARALPVEERYELAQSLLESISPADELGAVPVYDWQRDAVRDAQAVLEKRPDGPRPSESVEEEIERDLAGER